MIAANNYEEVSDKYEYLLEKRAITLETHEKDSLYRIIQVQQLKLSLERMQTNLTVVKRNTENLTIKAPITGQLTSLNAEIGETKSKGQRLGQIDLLDGFKLRAGVDEHYITRIDLTRTGTWDFANTLYHLIVKKIYPEVKEGKFEIDFEFTGEQPQDLRRGQTLHIKLELGDLSQCVLLAKGSFYQATGGQWVYVVDESGEFAEKRSIMIGRENVEFYEIISGLQPGEKVLTSSYGNFGNMEKLILQ